MILDDMWMQYGRIPHPEKIRQAPRRCGLTRKQWEKKKRERENRKKARKRR